MTIKRYKLKIGTQEIENLNEFQYLGAHISSDGSDLKELKTNWHGKNVFNNHSQVFGNQTMNLDLRKRII